MRFNINHFIQKYPTVITKIMNANVDTNSTEAGTQKPGADVAFSILVELIKGNKPLADYGLTEADLTEELKKDYERVVAG